MDEKTLTQFKTEGDSAFPVENRETDNSSSSSEDEKTNIEQTGSSDQNQNQMNTKNVDVDTNFAKHPRWKEREDDWTKRFNEQEVRHLSEIEKLRQDITQKTSQDSRELNVPTWFGGDEQQWKEYQEYNKNLVAQAEENVFNRISAKTEEEQKKIKDATDYFMNQVTEIESDKIINPTGEKVDRNKLLKTALDFDLVDSKGRWNYKAAYLFMKNHSRRDTSNVDEKRKIANATISENHSETKQKDYTTSEDFQKPGARPW